MLQPRVNFYNSFKCKKIVYNIEVERRFPNRITQLPNTVLSLRFLQIFLNFHYSFIAICVY
jgi:hypothetical protein